MTRTRIVVFRSLLLLSLTVITQLALTSEHYPVVDDLFGHLFDNANHVLAFYVLTLLLDFSFPKTNVTFTKVIGLLIYGILIEILQSLTPYRSPSLVDVIADGVGIVSYRLSVPLLSHFPLLRQRWSAQR
jgi:VanZ family protein